MSPRPDPLIVARNARIADMYREGHSVRDIAKVENTTPHAVQNVVFNLGLTRREIYRPAPKRIWCGQCERNVVMAEAENCKSDWCKAKARAA